MSKHITGHTGLLCLLGSPVAHSVSPEMHNEACDQLGLDYSYLAFDVPEDKMPQAVEGLRTMGARGWNITMPGKNIMCKLADKVSPASEISGACNTIVNDNGVLTAYTTDGVGFMRAVAENGVDIIGKKMTLLGAGGAATAILVQAALDGVAEINVFNVRDNFFGRAEEIVAKLNERTSCKVTLHDFSDPEVLRASIADSAILVNGTSVGMAPKTENTIITDTTMFHKDLFVFDVIYNPQETRLLREAKEAGCKTGNGMYMLLYQGAASFKLWTGEDMPVEIIKEKYFSGKIRRTPALPNFPPAAGRFGDTRKKRHEQETAKGFCHGFLSAGRSPFLLIFFMIFFLISPLSVLHQAVLYTVYNNGLSLPSAHHVFRSP